jgi:hypothetical protein
MWDPFLRIVSALLSEDANNAQLEGDQSKMK